MTTTHASPHILLLGNGLNRLANPVSWASLLTQLDTARAFEDGERGTVPFPFLFEALLSARGGEPALAEMKREVEASVRGMRESGLHARVRGLGVGHFLTTNYDYLLENRPGEKMVVRKGMGASTGRTYDSLFRHRTLPDGRRVWHIHGEANQPASILLGFKHYVNSVQSMDRYLSWVDPEVEPPADGVVWNHREARSPCRNAATSANGHIVTSDPDAWSWVDHVLTSTVHVLGLGLGTSEMLLWRLLMYRRQKMAAGWRWRATGRASPPIHFYTTPPRSPSDHAHRKLLTAVGVTVHPMPMQIRGDGSGDYLGVYERSLDMIEDAIAGKGGG